MLFVELSSLTTKFAKVSSLIPFVAEDIFTSNISVTASKGIYTEDGAVLSALGLGINYDSLLKMLNLTTSICPDLTCEDILCHSEVSFV